MAKDFGDLVRQYGLIALVLVIVFWPGMIGAWFKASGFTKFAGFGVELTREDAEQLRQAEERIGKALEANAKLQSQLQDANATLTQLKLQQDDPQIQNQIRQQINASNTALQAAEKQSRQLEQSSQNLKPLLRKADAVLANDPRAARLPPKGG